MRKELESLPDDELLHAVLVYVIGKIGDDERQLDALNALPEGLRVFYAVWLVDPEVKNGGFSQYVWNNGGGGAAAAVGGFELLGAEEHASLMKEAVETWERERELLAPFLARGTLEAFSESTRHTALGPLDMRYYELPDIEPVLASFIRLHPELFDE